MKIFVTGATGFQGGNIAKALLDDNHKVITLKRDLTSGMPVMPGVEVIKGGLENKESLIEVIKGTQAAVYSFPLIFDIDLAKTYTKNFIAAAKQENVELIIFNTTFYLPTKETGFLALDMKVAMKELFDNSDLNVITLVPDIYLDNIAAPWSIPVILENKIVPYPIASNKKLPWISHFDLAKYVAKAVTKPELAGQTLPIGGNLVTGKEITSAISSKIDQSLDFIEVPVNEFEEQLKPGFGEVGAREISNLYRFVEQNHSDFINKDFQKTNELLGISPQSISDWVASVNWNVS
ncbi:NmrA family transcriptional regulator [Aquimarina aggregata]|uniref:NmrA family transcriptional regulator n=1 Tax=Aquimarina aggregata TaxID=1642818 RepID=A0A162XNW7_9FLAO|nr:NmrA family NAD(P)-binding protein [Aquimarina aggregata]KZS38719.1 NmrA family transcriptional regulator [Aquimarina aggregata]